MTTYNWKILELGQKNGRVTCVKYYCEATNNGFKVATEGNCKFKGNYEMHQNISEHQVLHWLEIDGEVKQAVTKRLDEQLATLENTDNREPPWKVETFKVTL